MLGGADLDLDPERGGHGANHLDGVGPVPGPAGPENPGALVLTSHDGADMSGLGGNARLEGCLLGLAGAPGDSGDRGGNGTDRVGDGADLEDGNVSQAARDVAPGDVDQGVEHAGAQVGGVLGQGVGQTDRLSASIVGGNLEQVVDLPDEGVGQDLGESGVGQGAHDVAAGPLVGTQPRAGGGRGHDDRDGVVSVEAGDLLGQVGRPHQVRAPGRRGDGQQRGSVVGGATALHGAADGGEQLGDALGSVGDAGEALGGVGAHGDGLGGPGAVDVGGHGLGGAAAVLHEQVNGALGGDGGQLGVHAALVALGGLGGQLVASRGAGHADRVEVGGLDEDVTGVGVDLAEGPAEDTGQDQGP